jgi:hypothetical protein
MSNRSQSAIAKRVADYYLTSSDFNGYPLRLLASEFEIPRDQLLATSSSLVQRGRVSVVTSHEENPYVKRFPNLPKERQLDLLRTSDLDHPCLYPSSSQLKRVVSPTNYKGRPFTLRLARGEPQLAYAVFKLTVLEAYRNDPRYYYSTDNVSGHISMLSKHAKTLRRSDQVLLQSFGFAFNAKLDRAVAVFLRYLCGLSPEHQQIWQAMALPRHRYKLHPDYFRSSILGQWYEGVSVFDAVLEEMHCVNEMCKLIGWLPLFRKEFREGSKPIEFGFLIRPTLSQFGEFIHLLDKILSENLNRQFFEGQVPSESELVRKDGRIEVRHKNTIQMLDDWLTRRFRTPDRTPVIEAIQTFKLVRGMRQKPAHSVDDNVFDQKYYHQQRETMEKVYGAVQTLRLILANHPKASAFRVPDALAEGRIWVQ